MTDEQKAAFWAEWDAALEQILVEVDRLILATCDLPLYAHPLDRWTYALTDRRESREAWEQAEQRRDEVDAGHRLPDVA